MSQYYVTGSGGGGSGIVTIDGDTGSITGSTVTIYADNAALNCGSSVLFANSGTTSTLSVTDGNLNTVIGSSSGIASLPSSENTIVGAAAFASVNNSNASLNAGLGYHVFHNLTSGGGNSCAGAQCFPGLSGGSYNCGLGYRSGANYSGGESYNVLIASVGVNSENSVLRIGDTTGTGSPNALNSAYIQGVYSNSQAIGASVDYVTINTSTGQLGVTATAAGSITLNPDSGEGSPVSGNTINIQAFSDPNFPNACGSSVFFYGDTSTSPQTLVLNLSDNLSNTILGNNAGNSSLSGSGENVILGASAFKNATNDFYNTGIGYDALGSVAGGASYNTAIGYGSGSNYTGGETANILLQSGGVTGESNVMRLGNSTGTGSFGNNQTFITGLWSTTQNPASGIYFVTVNSNSGSSQDLCGVTALTPLITSWTDEAISFNAASGNGYFCSAALTATLPSSPSQGDMVSIAADTSGTVVVQASTGQTIRISSVSSSSGGTATSGVAGSSLQLVYRAANSEWFSIATEGNWTLA